LNVAVDTVLTTVQRSDCDLTINNKGRLTQLHFYAFTTLEWQVEALCCNCLYVSASVCPSVRSFFRQLPPRYYENQ